MNKNMRKMVSKVDKEGYHKGLLERDKKTLHGLLHPRQRTGKIFNFISEMTGIHRFKQTHDHVEDENGDSFQIWRCQGCGYECTEYAQRWEIIKGLLRSLSIWIGFPIGWGIFFLSVPNIDAFPSILKWTGIGLWLFFNIANFMGIARIAKRGVER